MIRSNSAFASKDEADDDDKDDGQNRDTADDNDIVGRN